MTWSAAFPGVAVRVLRAVAGRRALQVGLLVGGLFVLGFLCGGGQAYAADGYGVLPGRTVGQPEEPPAELRATHTATATGAAADTDTDTDTDTAKGGALVPVASAPVASAPVAPAPVAPAPVAPAPVVPGSGTEALPHPADGKVRRPVTEDVIGAVADGVVQPVGDLVEPVGDLVETVTTGLTGTVGIPAQPTLPGWPTMPSFPEAPSWPTLPTVPGAPTVPGLPGIPGQTLPAPAPAPVPAPVTSAPQHPQPGDHAADKPAGDKRSADGGAAYGPRFGGHGTVTQTVPHPSAHRTASTAHAPAHQAPSDNPGGALGGKSAVDSGPSRHGDAHAITLDHRAPLRLVPGAAASVDAAGTRDRHRDIPVFPG
ncbi:hypothetical protein [Streptomyces sp. NPDC005760]|uniref:hypothetical protein n=1 Tax=Streptomyces sp. NPDC005760 TaxID=3156718 RepID=UPI0033C8D2D3